MKVILCNKDVQPIQGGEVLNTIRKLLKGLSDAFFKVIDSFPKYNIEIKKVEERDDGVDLEVVVHTNMGDITGTISQENLDNGKIKFSCKFSKGTSIEPITVDADKTDKALEEFLSTIAEVFGVGREDVTSSKKLTFTVTRTPIKGSTEDSIDLQRIDANYEICDAISDMHSVLDSDAVIAQLPSDGLTHSFQVVSNDDTLYASGCDSCPGDNCKDIFTRLLHELLVMQINFQTIGWNLKNSKDICYYVRDTEWNIRNDIDTLSEIYCMTFGCVPNPLNLCVNSVNDAAILVNPDFNTNSLSAVTAYQYLLSMISDYCNILDIIRVNFEADIEHKILDIRYSWRRKLTELYRMCEDTTSVCDDIIPLIIQEEGIKE